ncbi:family 16 glycoside hydrolase [Planobispora takensis]|uniref:family 16 glycoside hydrolase n=1 Tax=Planobispora takensis TaxID=1367882 RepID=UPI0019454F5C|nr:family 16 glycoside hydrolase [Planobispora takensis]
MDLHLVRRAVRRRLAAAVLGAVALAAAGSCSGQEAVERWEEGAAHWDEGGVHGDWRVIFDGGGFTGRRPDGTLLIAPPAPESEDVTHAGLIVSTGTTGEPDLRMRLRTLDQTRPDPNVWEVAWAVWHYTGPQNFYYLLLKPNGWELGKADPAFRGAQRFLATGPGPFPIGRWYEVRVRQSGARMTAWVDGRKLVDYTDGRDPYLQGAVGLYAEDAVAEFTSVSLGGHPLRG